MTVPVLTVSLSFRVVGRRAPTSSAPRLRPGPPGTETKLVIPRYSSHIRPLSGRSIPVRQGVTPVFSFSVSIAVLLSDSSPHLSSKRSLPVVPRSPPRDLTSGSSPSGRVGYGLYLLTGEENPGLRSRPVSGSCRTYSGSLDLSSDPVQLGSGSEGSETGRLPVETPHVPVVSPDTSTPPHSDGSSLNRSLFRDGGWSMFPRPRLSRHISGHTPTSLPSFGVRCQSDVIGVDRRSDSGFYLSPILPRFTPDPL